MKVEYSEPKVMAGKILAVYYRAKNPETGERKEFKFEKGLNLKNVQKTERLRRANALRKYLSDWLKEGGNPFERKDVIPVEKKTLIQVLTDVLQTKKSSFKPKSFRNYTDILRNFTTWLNNAGLSKLIPQKLTRQHMQQYSDYMLTVKHWAGKTHNVNIGIIRALLSELEDREIIRENPAVKIKFKKIDTGKNFPFTQEEKYKLLKFFKLNNPHFYLACCFTYYCFLRRSELIELKFEHIDLENKVIIIHSKGAKGRKQQSVTIPKAFEKLLREFKFDKFPKHYYVFGRYMQPNEVKTTRPDYFSFYFRKVADQLKIDPTKGYYAWKHTGVCTLYRTMKRPDLNVIRIHCRHSDIRTTMIYLRSLGLDVNETIRETDFRI